MEREELTLRDQLALSMPADTVEFNTPEALSEFMGEELPDHQDTQRSMEFFLRVAARLRYQYADAMLAERSR